MRKKAFDCVEMKRRIQAELLRERNALGPAAWRRKIRKEILADPILGPFWREATRVPQPEILESGKTG